MTAPNIKELVAALNDASLYFTRRANNCRGTVQEDCLAAGYEERAATQKKAAIQLESLQAQVTAPLPDEVKKCADVVRNHWKHHEFADLIERQAKALSWAHDVNDAAEAENNRLYEQAQCSAAGQCECWKVACKNESNEVNKWRSKLDIAVSAMEHELMMCEDTDTADNLDKALAKIKEYARANTEKEG